jgi:hypothetical protein
MSIKQFLDQTKGNWVSTKTCAVNDVFTITTAPVIDNKSFENKTYLIMDVKKESTNEALKLRLSGQQVQNLEPTFGDDAVKWVGRKVKIAAKQMYPGLGKEGFIYIPT